jgi:hypothetical protein
MPYIEHVVLPSGRFKLSFQSPSQYLLDYNGVVVYENGKRKVRGRVTPYHFRSVEKMRYDFENDVKAL